ncbi:MAG: 3-dehydroquinate synthase [bacterium]|nr:3-dehydroquinate synthase [bacterium]
MKLQPKRLSVQIGEHTKYPIIIGINLEKEILSTLERESQNRRIAIITDSRVKKMFGQNLLSTIKKAGQKAELLTFAHGETNKSQATVTALQHALLKKKYGRDTFIIALGGGVVGDVVGFVAATYLRGVPYIQMPTTLLAMVDSSVGGKVGINTPFGKNTVGAFHQPKAVIADLNFLAHQSRKEIINGLMEAIKIFFTSDKDALSLAIELNLDSPLKTRELFQEVIFRSVQIKAGIAGRDEKESGERSVVNFGHTIGHSLELLSGFRLPHGYAVGYGILVEAKIAELMHILSTDECVFIQSYLKTFGITTAPLRKFSLPKILKATKGDKKVRGGKPRYVLLSSIGSVYKKDGQFAHPVPDPVVKKAFQALTK